MPETRDRIVAATNELFRRQGYHGTSLKQVSLAAAAPIGSIYHHFPGGKEELARVVLETTGAAYLELYHLVTAGCDSAAEAVETFFREAAAALEESDFIELCPIGTVAREVATTSPLLRVTAAAVLGSWTAAVAERLLADGLPAGEAAALAATVVAGIEGGFLLARVGRRGDQLAATGRHLATLIRAAVAAGDVSR